LTDRHDGPTEDFRTPASEQKLKIRAYDTQTDGRMDTVPHYAARRAEKER